MTKRKRNAILGARGFHFALTQSKEMQLLFVQHKHKSWLFLRFTTPIEECLECLKMNIPYSEHMRNDFPFMLNAIFL
jgi:hypothetical protein